MTTTLNKYTEITSVIMTKKQAHDLIVGIDMIIKSFYSNKTTLEQNMNEIFSYDTVAIIMQLCKKNDIDLKKVAKLEHFLIELKTFVENLPIIKVTLPIEPKIHTVKKIYSWISTNVQKNFILDISTDNTILGGALIGYKGKYFDYSLRNALVNNLRISDTK